VKNIFFCQVEGDAAVQSKKGQKLADQAMIANRSAIIQILDAVMGRALSGQLIWLSSDR
jgi:hypothetical protein